MSTYDAGNTTPTPMCVIDGDVEEFDARRGVSKLADALARIAAVGEQVAAAI